MRAAINLLLFVSLCLTTSDARSQEPPPRELVVTITVLPETVWQRDFAGKRLSAADLLAGLKKTTVEQNLTPPVEIDCILKEEGQCTSVSGKRMPFPQGWEPVDDDVTKLQPLDEMMRIVGSEVKLRLSKSDEGVDGKSPSLEVELELVHVFGDPKTHPVNYGAAATTAAERLRLSAPLSIFDQLEWWGTVVVHAQEPTLVANVLRRTQSPQNPAAVNRCLVFLKQAPLP